MGKITYILNLNINIVHGFLGTFNIK